MKLDLLVNLAYFIILDIFNLKFLIFNIFQIKFLIRNIFQFSTFFNSKLKIKYRFSAGSRNFHASLILINSNRVGLATIGKRFPIAYEFCLFSFSQQFQQLTSFCKWYFLFRFLVCSTHQTMENFKSKWISNEILPLECNSFIEAVDCAAYKLKIQLNPLKP